MVASGILVDELLEEDGKIVGIRAGEDEMYADVVIAADGVNSLIAQKAGLRGEISAHSVGVGVKEVIELPESVIQSRFRLTGDEGAALVVLGCTEGISGGAFIYTNRESISLGIVFNPEQAAHHGKRIHEILQDFKTHPAILPLIEGGETAEYGAHLVPELGYTGIPQRLHREGLLLIGDAAGFCINAGIILRGMDLAILSGLAAANAVIRADRVAEMGAKYRQELELLLLPTMKVFAGYHEIMGLPRLFTAYPDLANEAMKFAFTVDGKVPQKMTKALWDITKKHVSVGQMLSDGWKGVRAI